MPYGLWLEPDEATALIRDIIKSGEGTDVFDHFFGELEADGNDMQDALNVLRYGQCGQAFESKGDWRYMVRKNEMTVVVRLDSWRLLTMITTWMKGGER